VLSNLLMATLAVLVVWKRHDEVTEEVLVRRTKLWKIIFLYF
jgi:hypothetical protein